MVCERSKIRFTKNLLIFAGATTFVITSAEGIILHNQLNALANQWPLKPFVKNNGYYIRDLSGREMQAPDNFQVAEKIIYPVAPKDPREGFTYKKRYPSGEVEYLIMDGYFLEDYHQVLNLEGKLA